MMLDQIKRDSDSLSLTVYLFAEWHLGLNSRGIKVDDTPILPMNMIYYNFIRPHQALDGRTPAEAAGIGVIGDNRWMELLKRSNRDNRY